MTARPALLRTSITYDAAPIQKAGDPPVAADLTIIHLEHEDGEVLRRAAEQLNELALKREPLTQILAIASRLCQRVVLEQGPQFPANARR